MGSCVSVHNNKDPKSAMKLRIFASKSNKLVSPSPLKDKPLDKTDTKFPDPQIKPQVSPVLPVTSFSDYGSKEEAFFDSQAWLESDCDDDFHSVKGDFTPSVGNTPSRGNTPMHRGLLTGNRTPSVERLPAFLPQSSPKHKRKNLLELFKESRNGNANQLEAEDNQNESPAYKEAGLPPKSTSSTPNVSSGKRTPSRELKSEAKSPRSAQCCLPRLRSSGSFSERRKSISSAHSVV